jgi:hypothetical protein
MDDQKYEVHPAATLFPMMSDDEFEGLKQDILENGQREHVVFWCGALLDGRNRMRACEELGIAPNIFDLPLDKDPWKYVISHNLHRRHLSTSQRAMIASKLANLKNGERKANIDASSQAVSTSQAVSIDTAEGVETAGSSEKASLDDAAKQLNVGRATVARAKQIQATGSEELIAAVERDEISVSAGAEIAEMPIEEQKAVLAEGREFTKAVAAEKRNNRKKAASEVQASAVPMPSLDAFAEDEYMDPNDILAILRKLMPRINDKTILAEILFGISDEYEKFRIPEIWEEWMRKRVRD